MHRTVLTLLLLQAIGSGGQEATAQKAALLVSTVKHGDLAQMVRGLGVLKDERTAEVTIAQSNAGPVRVGQKAVVDTGRGTVTGQVIRVAPEVENAVAVDVRLDSAPPAGVSAGRDVDGAIVLLTLQDVDYVGGPTARLSELEQQSETLFRLEPDGRHAVRVRVEFGLTGRSTGETRFDKVIEIRSGLQPGDTVVVSDMSVFNGKDRIRVQ
jgi:HlyD family secretion protein